MATVSKSQLISLQKKFKTDDAIGKQFGITRQAVHQLRKKYGISSSIANNPDRNSKIVEARNNGKPVQAIAKTFKLSIPQVYRIIKENN